MADKLPGGYLTTAMGILPHKNLEEALSLAMSLDVPFWPQIPRSFTSLAAKLEEIFVYVSNQGIAMDELLDRAWLAPSRCCLVNPDRAKTVEASFKLLKELGDHFKEKYKLY